jgi:hypothetical protein
MIELLFGIAELFEFWNFSIEKANKEIERGKESNVCRAYSSMITVTHEPFFQNMKP